MTPPGCRTRGSSTRPWGTDWPCRWRRSARAWPSAPPPGRRPVHPSPGRPRRPSGSRRTRRSTSSCSRSRPSGSRAPRARRSGRRRRDLGSPRGGRPSRRCRVPRAEPTRPGRWPSYPTSRCHSGSRGGTPSRPGWRRTWPARRVSRRPESGPAQPRRRAAPLSGTSAAASESWAPRARWGPPYRL